MKPFFYALLLLLTPFALSQAEEKKASGPLKVVLITGGGYHDYKVLNPLITKKLSELINAEFTVKDGMELLKDPKFADNYDVLVYNFCFADEKNKELIDNALKATQAGKPTVMVHCAMHTFMASDEWTDCCGMRTRRHDPYSPFSITKAAKDHPIVKNLPNDWKTSGDELYQTIKLGERSTALLKGTNTDLRSDHIVAWISTYGKARIFATTLGHDVKTVTMPAYHQLLANGILWAADKLDKEGKPTAGYAKGK